MNYLKLSLVFLLTLSACTQGGKWEALFGEGFELASFPEGSWIVQGEKLVALEDQVVWAPGVHENFQLELEFMNEEGTNSGVIV